MRFPFVLLVTLLFSSCKSDLPTTPMAGNPIPSGTVVKQGTFVGQNGYVTSGTVTILRDSTNGNETLATASDFRVSGGAGTIGVWLADAAGAGNLNASSMKVRLGTITSGFSGVFSFPIAGNNSSLYTHVVTFCEGARVNFGNAPLAAP